MTVREKLHLTPALMVGAANIQHVNILAQLWKIAMHNITSVHGADLQ